MVGIVALRLTFGDVVIYVNDVDELVCSTRPPADIVADLWDARNSLVFWRRAIGKPLRYVRSMRNHRGYDDGLQLEFGHADGPCDTFAVQLVAIATRVSVSAVAEML